MPQIARWRYVFVSATGDDSTVPGSVRFIDKETSSNSTVGILKQQQLNCNPV